MAGVVSDFHADWIAILRDSLQRDGYTVPADLSPDETCLRFFNAAKRRIPAIPRTISISLEFTCPPAQQAALSALVSKIQQGDDLTPNLSKSILALDFSDALLNDWGIHHFHLGDVVDQSGFVSRTGPLVFAHLTPERALLIDVRAHGNWSSLDLLEILHSNWPDVLEKARLFDVIESESTNPSESEVDELRRAGVQYLYRMAHGTVYGPLGGGYMLSGVSVDARLQTIRYNRIVQELEGNFLSEAAQLRSKLPDPGLRTGDMHLRLVVDQGRLYVREEKTGTTFNIPPGWSLPY